MFIKKSKYIEMQSYIKQLEESVVRRNKLLHDIMSCEDGQEFSFQVGDGVTDAENLKVNTIKVYHVNKEEEENNDGTQEEKPEA